MSTPEDRSPIRYRFVGEPGEYLPGIPARDLTDADVFGLSDDVKNEMRAHLGLDPEAGHRVLYQRVKPKKGEQAADLGEHRQELDGSADPADTAG